MVTVTRTDEFLTHAGKKGMKWGYNDGSRNGRRTANELKSVQQKAREMAKSSNAYDVSDDFVGDYDEANNMLKYLGITLDLQSDDESVVRTMQIYKDMANSKDKYKTQYDWLRAFSNRLSSVGYDMDAVTKMLDSNKDKLNQMTVGTGTGNRERSNQDWKENDAKAGKSKKTKTSDKKKKTTTTKKKSSSTRKYSYDYKPDEYWDPSKVKHSDNQNGEELYHWGVLHQKWGVRRYQNPDGSLTDEGRIHYGYSAKRRNSTVEKLSGQSAKESKKASNKAKAEEYNEDDHNSNVKLAKNTVSTAMNTGRILNKSIDKAEEAKYRKKLEKMTNEELEAEIAKAMPDYEARVLRQQLEQKYNKVIGNEESTKAGREKVMDALEVVGGVSLASIAVVDLIIKLRSL